MYKYLVQCWIRPSSGFDLARKQRIMDMFKELMQVTFPGDKVLEEKVEEFNKEHEGFILEPFVMESDKEIVDYEKELMPEIWKKHPEAKLMSCEKIPELLK